MASATKKMVLVLVGMILALVCFVSGLLIGWFLLDSSMTSHNDTMTSDGGDVRPGGKSKQIVGLDERYTQEADNSITAKLLEQIQASNIERYLRLVACHSSQ
jgi:hypothetical protein